MTDLRRHDRFHVGTPAPTCPGYLATIVGHATRGKLVGTDQDDVIVGAGSQRIYGKGGDDIICAGPGIPPAQPEGVRGGGDDKVYASSAAIANAYVAGGPGTDTCVAGTASAGET